MFDIITTWMSGLGNVGVAALMLAENVFPPIPSELVMPLAGYLSAEGQLWLPAAIFAGTIGSVLGALFWYYIGIWIGEERLQRFAARHGAWLTLSPKDVDSAGTWFRDYGWRAVFFGRMIPGVRTLISVPAGMARMPLRPFLIFTTLGSLIWTGLLAAAGFLLQAQYDAVAAWVDPVSTLVIVGLIGVYIFRLIKQFMRR
ncbi:DedA family protein [Sulfitobacter pontiacus]|uniref:DedA family protein n=1 Tax=Sulfitobacter pontiacus TaxID=60137 RepID=UPI0027794078|nr:DedA family protein [Sulfitobacter pontiacus]GLO77963.1 alkaline phosphatase [Sulfitobacter pontiacus]